MTSSRFSCVIGVAAATVGLPQPGAGRFGSRRKRPTGWRRSGGRTEAHTAPRLTGDATSRRARGAVLASGRCGHGPTALVVVEAATGGLLLRSV